MIAHPLGIMVRIAPVASAAAANEGPGISPTSELSALLPVLSAASAAPDHEAPSLDAAPSIGVPFAQHGVSAEEPTPARAETAETATAAGD